MLVLASKGLIIFIVASMGLCFGSVLKTVLIIQGFSPPSHYGGSERAAAWGLDGGWG